MRTRWGAARRFASAAALGLGLLPGCEAPDPRAHARMVDRNQLRREVRGLRMLDDLAPGQLMDRRHEVLVTVTDTLLRTMLAAALPLEVPVRSGFTLTVTSASVAFRSNVAGVDFVGQLRRVSFPSVAATVRLRGALDDFVVDSTRELRARINIDDVIIEAPTGAPDALNGLAVMAMQRVVERSLPELVRQLPGVTVPVRLSRDMLLPGFGKGTAVSVAESRAAIGVEAARVIAFQNRLWIILRVDLGEFSGTAVADR